MKYLNVDKMHGNELVSVIIPVYNQEKYLEKCINSILSQTWNNLEIILVDDGSTDGSVKICDKIAESDKRVKAIHKSNEGLSTARVTGLKESCGEWILFVDDDDLISIYLVEILLSFTKSGYIDIVAGGRLDTIDAESFVAELNRKVPEKITFSVDNGKNICKKISSDQQKTIITPMWGKLYRREFLLSVDIEKYRYICPTIYFEDVLMTPIIYCQAKRFVL